MLMKQSKMQFQEIQISPLDNGGPEQLHFNRSFGAFEFDEKTL